MELYEKIYVHPSFLDTVHGEIDCVECHGGDAADPDWRTAHNDVVKDPTVAAAGSVCGDCHEEIAAAAPGSLHYTLAPFRTVVKARSDHTDSTLPQPLDRALSNHCSACHASCGQCHVSRPDYVAGGFLSRHLFVKTPPMNTVCAGCHGGRVHAEYTGANDDYKPDIHHDREEMTCTDCHQAAEMHADATGVSSRFALPQRPRCRQCHETSLADAGGNIAHQLHNDKVACQVCHGQANKHCFRCHVGTDAEGLPYYKCQKTTFQFKIGLNPAKSPDRPYDWVVLRHPPTAPDTFDHYGEKALGRFAAVPTWKLDTPHNIQRITEQNKTCNNCHGNAALFLQSGDLAEWERAANQGVMVPAERIPEPVTDNEKGG